MTFRVVEYESVSSTNDVLIRLARQGAQEGLVVRSDFQRKGRGRGKRRWYSPKGKDLLVSLLVKPDGSVSKISHLTTLGCQAALETVRSYLPNATLKLPNDVLVNRKKIAGVLVEGQAKGGKQKWACVGVGINVGASKSQIFHRGTSLYIENGVLIELNDVLSRFISIFSEKFKKMFKYSEFVVQ